MSKSFKTFLKHAGKDYYNQSVNPPVVRASTLIFKSIEEIRKTQNKAIKEPCWRTFYLRERRQFNNICFTTNVEKN